MDTPVLPQSCGGLRFAHPPYGVWDPGSTAAWTVFDPSVTPITRKSLAHPHVKTNVENTIKWAPKPHLASRGKLPSRQCTRKRLGEQEGQRSGRKGL